MQNYPCDSYLGQNIDTSFQLYENDGTFENPLKGKFQNSGKSSWTTKD